MPPTFYWVLKFDIMLGVGDHYLRINDIRVTFKYTVPKVDITLTDIIDKNQYVNNFLKILKS